MLLLDAAVACMHLILFIHLMFVCISVFCPESPERQPSTSQPGLLQTILYIQLQQAHTDLPA